MWFQRGLDMDASILYDENGVIDCRVLSKENLEKKDSLSYMLEIWSEEKMNKWLLSKRNHIKRVKILLYLIFIWTLL